MSGHDIIVIGASAGGVEALTQVIRSLPPDLPAAIFVVLHISPRHKSFLPQILSRYTSLVVSHALDGEKIKHGHIYIAPPDKHLLIKPGHICLSSGPKENMNRPAVDLLFRTAAKIYGTRVVGVILSGTLDDGTAGLLAVKRRAGVVIVQNPEEALYDGMLRSAIENVKVDRILLLSEIAPALVSLAHEQVVENSEFNDEVESDMTKLDAEDRSGKESPFSCLEKSVPN